MHGVSIPDASDTTLHIEPDINPSLYTLVHVPPCISEQCASAIFYSYLLHHLPTPSPSVLIAISKPKCSNMVGLNKYGIQL